MKCFAILGPTASGKTDLGIELAERYGCEIISADSVQIYKHLDIGSAKPSPEIRTQIPHWLIDILDPTETYSVGKFLKDAQKAVESISLKNRIPVILGGTYLYIRAFFNGLAEIPEISLWVKEEVRQLHQNQGIVGCYTALCREDPESAERLHPNDTLRIMRALKVFRQTGKSICSFQKAHGFQERLNNPFLLLLEPLRENIYQKINARVLSMMHQGLVQETQKILNQGTPHASPALQSIGYKQVVQYLFQKMNYDEMVLEIQKQSRRYAKRQITWSKHYTQAHWKSGEGKTVLWAKIEAYLAES